MYLETINNSKDLKYLSLEQLNILSAEVRKALLHKIFNCSKDKYRSEEHTSELQSL